MAYDTLGEALEALATLTSSGDALKADLLNLVKQVSVEAEGAVTVLYSGKVDGVGSGDIIKAMLANGEDVRVLDESAAGTFLKSAQFRAKVAEAFGITLIEFNSDGYSGPATNWLNDATNGPWADASKRFAEASSGDIRVIAGEGNPARIFCRDRTP